MTELIIIIVSVIIFLSISIAFLLSKKDHNYNRLFIQFGILFVILGLVLGSSFSVNPIITKLLMIFGLLLSLFSYFSQFIRFNKN